MNNLINRIAGKCGDEEEGEIRGGCGGAVREQQRVSPETLLKS